MNVRKITEDDWEDLVSWWDYWPEWRTPHRDMLPEGGTGGVIIEKNNTKVAACFIFTSNSKTAWLEFVISNPHYKEKDRSDLIEEVITAAETICKNLGYSFVYSVGRNKSLVKKYKKLGWWVDDKPSFEMYKYLK